MLVPNRQGEGQMARQHTLAYLAGILTEVDISMPSQGEALRYTVYTEDATAQWCEQDDTGRYTHKGHPVCRFLQGYICICMTHNVQKDMCQRNVNLA